MIGFSLRSMMIALSGSTMILARPANAVEQGRGPLLEAPGLQYRIIKAGPTAGQHPKRSSAIKVRYDVKTPNGVTYDNNHGEPAIVPLRSLIPGFQEALLMMRPGDIWEIYIPQELAYGDAGSPLSGKSLVARIELIEVGDLPPPPSPYLKEMPGKPIKK